MRRRLSIFGGIALLVAAGIVARNFNGSSDAAAFDEQMRLARREGIATTWQEFAKRIPHVAPAENAAPIYQGLMNRGLKSVDFEKLETNLVFHPSTEVVAVATKTLASMKDDLQSIDRAAALPRCWFNRDWSKGLTIWSPETQTMKSAAKLVVLRGSLMAAAGRPAAAIQDLHKLERISSHCSEEGTKISILASYAIYAIGLKRVEEWAIAHRTEPAYLRGAKAMLAAWPKIDLQAFHRTDMLEVVGVIDLCRTPEGRHEIGLKAEDVSPFDPVASVLLSQPKAKIKAVEALRLTWESYGDPPSKRKVTMPKAKSELQSALLAFPTVYQFYFGMTQEDGGADFMDQRFESRRLTHVGLLRALAGREIPKTIRLSDLLSPVDGKPLTYAFDGRQIRLTLTDPDSENKIQLQIPTNTQFEWLGTPKAK